MSKKLVLLMLMSLVFLAACAPPNYYIEQSKETPFPVEIKAEPTSEVQSVEIANWGGVCPPAGWKGPLKSREERGFEIKTENNHITYSYAGHEEKLLVQQTAVTVSYKDGSSHSYVVCHSGLYHKEN